MASTISAGTTSGTAIAISGDTTGNLAFQTQAGANTITVPNATGTVMVSGNMPAFIATNSGTQTYSASTFTKVLFQTENYDTNNNFASSTFTPTVAGYYQITASINHDYAGSNGNINSACIYKNGSSYQISSVRGSVTYGGQQATALIYCNGSTDYIEVYAYSNNGSPQINTSGTGGSTLFSGVLVRTA